MSKFIRVTESTKARMEALREEFYQNTEIAKICGCSYLTVLHTIGKQPPEMTAKYRTIRIKAQKEKEQVRVSLAREKRIKEAQEIYAKQADLIRQQQNLLESKNEISRERAEILAQIKRDKEQLELAKERLAESHMALTAFNSSAAEKRSELQESIENLDLQIKMNKNEYRKAAQYLVKVGVLHSATPIRTNAVPNPADLTLATIVN